MYLPKLLVRQQLSYDIYFDYIHLYVMKKWSGKKKQYSIKHRGQKTRDRKTKKFFLFICKWFSCIESNHIQSFAYLVKKLNSKIWLSVYRNGILRHGSVDACERILFIASFGLMIPISIIYMQMFSWRSFHCSCSPCMGSFNFSLFVYVFLSLATALIRPTRFMHIYSINWVG